MFYFETFRIKNNPKGVVSFFPKRHFYFFIRNVIFYLLTEDGLRIIPKSQNKACIVFWRLF